MTKRAHPFTFVSWYILRGVITVKVADLYAEAPGPNVQLLSQGTLPFGVH
jgi:hypothetical protein